MVLYLACSVDICVSEPTATLSAGFQIHLVSILENHVQCWNAAQKL